MKNHFRAFILASVLLVSCNSKKEEEPVYTSHAMSYSDMGSSQRVSRYSAMAVSNSTSNTGAYARQQRMIIKTANISAEVISYDSAVATLERITKENNGYIVSSTSNSEEKDRKSGTIVIRIPAAVFDSYLNDVVSVSSKVISKSIHGNDITEEYYDLSTRLENKKKIELRYREILKSAKTVEDILSVEKYLSEAREEIEIFEGRKRFLNDQAVLSTITVNYREPKAIVENEQEGFWQKIASGFRRGFFGFGDVLAYSITFIISAIPAIIILSGLLLGVLKTVKKYRSKKNKV